MQLLEMTGIQINGSREMIPNLMGISRVPMIGLKHIITAITITPIIACPDLTNILCTYNELSLTWRAVPVAGYWKPYLAFNSAVKCIRIEPGFVISVDL